MYRAFLTLAAGCASNILAGPEWATFNLFGLHLPFLYLPHQLFVRYIMESTPQTWPNYYPYIWPLPQQFTSGAVNITVNALEFEFQSNVSSTDLDAAFVRFNATLFPHVSASVGSSSNAITGVVVNVCAFVCSLTD